MKNEMVCVRAIYLRLEGQNDENGFMFGYEELFLKDGIVMAKSYQTTIEFLGDLLAMLSSHSGEEEEEEEEEVKDFGGEIVEY